MALVNPRARQRAGRPGPGILEPGFQNPGFFDPEKNLILNPEPGPDLKFSPETGPDPEFQVRAGPKNPARPGKTRKCRNLKMGANGFNWKIFESSGVRFAILDF